MQGAQGSIPTLGTRSHMLQLKILNAATKTWLSQINYFLKKEMQNPTLLLFAPANDPLPHPRVPPLLTHGRASQAVLPETQRNLAVLPGWAKAGGQVGAYA
ncbi:unnamed protein product [Rangifer tarandus platyrhynchus]|uniref:Uncharacterized protein n=1 Tax=Rangifer tarandus platyrhynchus TaxID=3082113 RepID=A0AC59ZVB5_RANTA